MYTLGKAIISNTNRQELCLKCFELFTYDSEQVTACLKHIQ